MTAQRANAALVLSRQTRQCLAPQAEGLVWPPSPPRPSSRPASLSRPPLLRLPRRRVLRGGPPPPRPSPSCPPPSQPSSSRGQTFSRSDLPDRHSLLLTERLRWAGASSSARQPGGGRSIARACRVQGRARASCQRNAVAARVRSGCASAQQLRGPVHASGHERAAAPRAARHPPGIPCSGSPGSDLLEGGSQVSVVRRGGCIHPPLGL